MHIYIYIYIYILYIHHVAGAQTTDGLAHLKPHPRSTTVTPLSSFDPSIMLAIGRCPSLLSPVALILLLLSTLINAHMIELPAGKKECFFEDLHAEDKVSPARAVPAPFPSSPFFPPFLPPSSSHTTRSIFHQTDALVRLAFCHPR